MHLLALMPWWVLYLHADVFYFFVYHLIGYRKKVVRQNLAECFPERDDHERKAIEKEFYHHLTDYFLETIKLLHISDEDMRKRMVFHNAKIGFTVAGRTELNYTKRHIILLACLFAVGAASVYSFSGDDAYLICIGSQVSLHGRDGIILLQQKIKLAKAPEEELVTFNNI